MRAGRLRLIIQVQEEIVAKDIYGGETKVWKEKGEPIRASIKKLGVKDGYTADQFYTKNIIQFKTRFFKDLSVKNRISYNDSIFNIIKIKNPNEIGKELYIECEEKAK